MATNAVVFLSKDNQVAAGDLDGVVRIWNLETGKIVRRLKDHSKEVTSVACSPDGKVLASASMDGTVRFWDSTTGDLFRIIRGHSTGVTSIAFAPDGATLAAGEGDDKHPGQIRLWDVKTGKEVGVLK
jgi:WD40 repeat protein